MRHGFNAAAKCDEDVHEINETAGLQVRDVLIFRFTERLAPVTTTV